MFAKVVIIIIIINYIIKVIPVARLKIWMVSLLEETIFSLLEYFFFNGNINVTDNNNDNGNDINTL